MCGLGLVFPSVKPRWMFSRWPYIYTAVFPPRLSGLSSLQLSYCQDEQTHSLQVLLFFNVWGFCHHEHTKVLWWGLELCNYDRNLSPDWWLGGLVAKLCPTLAIPWTVACQAPLSMGFSKWEYWSGLPFPSPKDLPHPGIKTWVSCIEGRFFTDWAMRETPCLQMRAI